MGVAGVAAEGGEVTDSEFDFQRCCKNLQLKAEKKMSKQVRGYGRVLRGTCSLGHGSKSRSRPPTRPAPRRTGLGDSDRTQTIRAKCYIER